MEAQADWTFLVYMNGDNNLESAAIEDFLEMSRIGSDSRLNIVVQFDRIENQHAAEYGDWGDTRRFRVLKGMEPTIDNALPGFAVEADMGNETTLREFVAWGRTTYPAKRYALVIWDHGAGWRFTTLAATAETSRLPALIDERRESNARGALRRPSAPPPANPLQHPVKSVSHDDTDSSSLYNRAIERALSAALAGSRIDVLGFDACLMGMVESAYAFRNVAGYMVASEDNEPNEGWNYEGILGRLKASSMDGRAVAKAIVETYERDNGRQSALTLSAIDLAQSENVGAAVDHLGDALGNAVQSARWTARVAEARGQCWQYAAPDSGYHNIDLTCLANAVRARVADPESRRAADAVLAALRLAVLKNYAGSERTLPGYTSGGMAIYFPASGTKWTADPLSAAYRNGIPADQYPVEFVDRFRWDEFLAAYAARVP